MSHHRRYVHSVRLLTVAAATAQHSRPRWVSGLGLWVLSRRSPWSEPAGRLGHIVKCARILRPVSWAPQPQPNFIHGAFLVKVESGAQFPSGASSGQTAVRRFPEPDFTGQFPGRVFRRTAMAPYRKAGLPREFVIHILKGTDAHELSRSLYIVYEATKGEDHCRSTD
jgi:hypothetical protein